MTGIRLGEFDRDDDDDDDDDMFIKINLTETSLTVIKLIDSDRNDTHEAV